MQELGHLDDVLRFWNSRPEAMGVSVFGVSVNMTLFRTVLSLFATIVPIIMTRLLAQWTGNVL